MNVVLVCFILFITIALLQHISNITRMMQQYTQQKLREALEQEQNNADTDIMNYAVKTDQDENIRAAIDKKTDAIEILRSPRDEHASPAGFPGSKHVAHNHCYGAP